MRELDLLSTYLRQLRSEKLQRAHQAALMEASDLLTIKAAAREAELCTRIHDAVKVLARDPGKFIEDYLTKERDNG